MGVADVGGGTELVTGAEDGWGKGFGAAGKDPVHTAAVGGTAAAAAQGVGHMGRVGMGEAGDS